MIVKNRKINLTFVVFEVRTSYLVRIHHIGYVFGENKMFHEKIFFPSTFQDFDQKISEVSIIP